MTPNRTAGAAFRNAVLLALHDAGLGSARTYEYSGTAGPALPGISNLVDGLDWALMTRVDRGSLDLSEPLRDANRLAQLLGQTRGAAVIPRKGHSVSESYVVTQLGDFASVLRTRQSVRRSA